MEQIIIISHLLVALAIIGLIMLQQGKGADMGASFGAGASQTLFGSDGSGNVLTRATAWLVAVKPPDAPPSAFPSVPVMMSTRPMAPQYS